MTRKNRTRTPDPLTDPAAWQAAWQATTDDLIDATAELLTSAYAAYQTPDASPSPVRSSRTLARGGRWFGQVV